MPQIKRVLIIGNGAAGTIAANKLRMGTSVKEVEIVVIGNSPQHYFKPDGVLIPFYLKRYQESVKDSGFLFNYGIQYVEDEAFRIDVEQRMVFLRSGRMYNYDFLVLATGTRFTPEDIPGYGADTKHFYDLPHCLELREILKSFKGGKIVVGQASVPIQCPPAPFEFALLLDDYLRSRGMREETEIDYVYPINRVFTIKHVSNYVQDLFDEKGIQYHTMFNVESIDNEKKMLNSLEGETLNYDLLVLVPPHCGQKVITDSGLAEGGGFVKVDRNKLTYGSHDDVFVIGDATDLPIPKNGAAAHFQAGYVANKLTHETSGGVYDDHYSGENCCPPFISRNKSVSLYMSYDRAPRGYYPSKLDFLFKWTSSDTYFTGMLRGLL